MIIYDVIPGVEEMRRQQILRKIGSFIEKSSLVSKKIILHVGKTAHLFEPALSPLLASVFFLPETCMQDERV